MACRRYRPARAVDCICESPRIRGDNDATVRLNRHADIGPRHECPPRKYPRRLPFWEYQTRDDQQATAPAWVICTCPVGLSRTVCTQQWHAPAVRLVAQSLTFCVRRCGEKARNGIHSFIDSCTFRQRSRRRGTAIRSVHTANASVGPRQRSVSTLRKSFAPDSSVASFLNRSACLR
jgi:hypothetical protein